jgi:DNA (cytosine-5)-methyltransferase 1
MWPEAIRSVREIWPSAFLFENVRGLARPAFADYLRWIRASLASPTIEKRRGESHDEHRVRIERARRSSYDVMVLKVNAADFGAPQKRMRVIVAGLRRDLGFELVPPLATHSRERLIWDQRVTGDYWKRHRMARPIRSHLSLGFAPGEEAWATVRDACKGLGQPNGKSNHILQKGARIYAGHTGSPLDEPAKALKAGDHGVPGGENMMVRDDGTVRYFTVREAARLQGFPDTYQFACAWSESMRQLGNAVPTQLSESLGRWLKNLLEKGRNVAEDAA